MRRDDRIYFTADDRSVTSTDFVRLSKTALTSRSELTDIVKGFVDEVKLSKVATSKAEKEAERQNRFLSVAERSKNNALNDVTSLHAQAVTDTNRETELLSSVSAFSIQIARATAELHQSCDTITMQNKELAEIVLLKISIKSVEDNVALYKASNESFNCERAEATTESTRPDKFFDIVSAKVANL